LKHAPKVILVIAVALSVGLHWVVLQSVAWAGMLVDYSAQHSLSVAFEKTFDGDNKCDLCLLVENGTKGDAENDSDHSLKLSKIDGFNARGEELHTAPMLLVFALLEVPLSAGRGDGPPPTPPPWA
jgi:hypothetical protein